MAKQPQVKCPRCKELFYREDCLDCVHDGHRYWHKECYDKKQEYDNYYNMIHDYCKKKYKNKYYKSRIDTQIKELLDDGKTISGIYRTLVYWYDVKGGEVEKSYGSIRIVNYIYDEAMDYYKNKLLLEQQQAELLKNPYNSETITYYISPTPIKKPKRVKLFDIH